MADFAVHEGLPENPAPGTRYRVRIHNVIYTRSGRRVGRCGDEYDGDVVMCYCGHWTVAGNFCQHCGQSQSVLEQDNG